MRTALTLTLVALAACCSSACVVGGDLASSSTGDGVTYPITHPALRAELLDLFERDQRTRKRMIEAIQNAPPPPAGEPYAKEALPAVRAAMEVDAESAELLERTLNESGWPTFEMVGEDGGDAAWLLAQHADHHPELQRRALVLMEAAVERGQAKAEKLAYLIDRVRIKDREPQRYGTQFGVDANGVHRPYPIEEGSEPIDLRRARVGLAPMAYAAREWAQALGVEASEQPLEDWGD